MAHPPFVLAQLSDPHLGADWGRPDAAARLARAVEVLRAFRPDAVLVCGDVAEHAADEEYEEARELLAALGDQVYVLPGNHDDRGALRRHFGTPGERDAPVQYAVDLGPLRLVMADTTRPGADDGALDDGRLEWLDAELGRAPQVPTILAMHHPPLLTGVPGWDEFALRDADRHALAEVVGRHRHVRRIAAGHVHRAITTELAGCPVMTVPSTYMQGRLALGGMEIEMCDDPAGFALHVVADGQIVSHLQPID